MFFYLCNRNTSLKENYHIDIFYKYVRKWFFEPQTLTFVFPTSFNFIHHNLNALILIKYLVSID